MNHSFLSKCRGSSVCRRQLSLEFQTRELRREMIIWSENTVLALFLRRALDRRCRRFRVHFALPIDREYLQRSITP